MGEQFVITPLAIIQAFENIEDDELNRRLYYAIKNTLKEHLKNTKGEFKSKDEMLNFWMEYLTYSGWGKLQLIDLNKQKNHAIISLIDNPNMGIIKGRDNADHIMRGMLAAIFCNIFNADVECIETQCCLNNEKECHFIIKKAEEFDYTKPEPRKQLTPKI